MSHGIVAQSMDCATPTSPHPPLSNSNDSKPPRTYHVDFQGWQGKKCGPKHHLDARQGGEEHLGGMGGWGIKDLGTQAGLRWPR